MLGGKPTDASLVKSILAGGRKKEIATQYLLKNNIGYVFKIVNRFSLSKQEARDALVDAVLAIIDKIEAGRFTDQAKLSTFLYQVFYNKCVDRLRKISSNKIDYLEVPPELRETAADPLRLISGKSEVNHLKGQLSKIGDPCRQILLDWGEGGYSMAEIAQRNGLADAGKAKRKKFNCLQKLMKFIQKTESKNRV